MSISYVLRLREDALAEGRFVGEVEAVADAQRRVFTTIEQVSEFILETGRAGDAGAVGARAEGQRRP